MEKLNVVVLCGGKSVESDISIITGYQAYSALDEELYNKHLVLLDNNNRWWLCKGFNSVQDVISCKKSEISLKNGDKSLYLMKKNKVKRLFEIDVVVMALHGGYGENGGIASILEQNDIAYTSSSIYGSATTLDKCFCKMILENSKINVAKYCIIKKFDYYTCLDLNLEKIIKKLDFPCIVKPACLGSSIGINIAHNKNELKKYVDLAFQFDNKILLEKAFKDFYELNISVRLKNGEIVLSQIEKPVKQDELLSFNDKYLSNGKSKVGFGASKGMTSLKREIPAHIDLDIKKTLEDYARRVYNLFDLKGIVRIDFIVSENKVYVNEINTIPGSLSFYLWNETQTNLLNDEINLALKFNLQRKDIVMNFESTIFK